MIGERYRSVIAGEQKWGLSEEYAKKLRGTLLEIPPAVISLDNADISDIKIINSSFYSKVEDSSKKDSNWLRIYPDAEVDSFIVSNITLKNYGKGIVIDENTSLSNVFFKTIIQKEIDKRWDIKEKDAELNIDKKSKNSCEKLKSSK